ncbi:hypothetical protein, partial [uncultured Lamprocystis sp.]|uniref:hypothetical protein n=1 Tax=uncultured Lamprocystis sp. TaxID=543132 RepID=UPI0025F0214A
LPALTVSGQDGLTTHPASPSAEAPRQRCGAALPALTVSGQDGLTTHPASPSAEAPDSAAVQGFQP